VQRNETRSDSHPAFLSNEEFEALPDWHDVEDNSAYDSKRRPSPVSSIATHRSAPRVVSSPPGFSPTPHFVALDNPSQIDLNSGEATVVEVLGSSTTPHLPKAYDSPSQLNSGQTTLVECSPAAPIIPGVTPPGSSQPTYRLGILPSTSPLGLRDQRRYPEIVEAQGPRSHSGSIVEYISSGSESESDDLHFGDGMHPRDSKRSTTARTRDGQRSAWIVTPGRPPIAEVARMRFSCRGIAPQHTHYVETESLDIEEVSLRLRGGAGSEEESFGIHNSSSHTLIDTADSPRSLHKRETSVYTRRGRPVSVNSNFIELMSLDGEHLYEKSQRLSGQLNRDNVLPIPGTPTKQTARRSSSLAPGQIRSLSMPASGTPREPSPSDGGILGQPHEVGEGSGSYEMTPLPPPVPRLPAPPAPPPPTPQPADQQRLIPSNAQIPTAPTPPPVDPTNYPRRMNMAPPPDPPGNGWHVCCDPEGCCYLCDVECLALCLSACTIQ
jgi:hypothetical protein